MQEQQNAIWKTIEVIEKNLDKNFTIDEIASEVGYSKAHFQRMFLYYTGQTLNKYLYQRRISEAAKRLVDSDEKILDIALRFGFTSHEAFSRAFKKYFGSSPYQYRKRSVLSSTKLKQGIQKDIIMSKTASKVDYIGNEMVSRFEVFGYSCDTMTLKDIYGVWNKINAISNANKFGILDYEENTAEVEFEYIAGVNDAFKDYEKKIIVEENQYAVFKHKGPYEEISASFRYIYGKWANDKRLDINYNYDFEKYVANEKGVLIYVPFNQ